VHVLFIRVVINVHKERIANGSKTTELVPILLLIAKQLDLVSIRLLDVHAPSLVIVSRVLMHIHANGVVIPNPVLPLPMLLVVPSNPPVVIHSVLPLEPLVLLAMQSMDVDGVDPVNRV